MYKFNAMKMCRCCFSLLLMNYLLSLIYFHASTRKVKIQRHSPNVMLLLLPVMPTLRLSNRLAVSKQQQLPAYTLTYARVYIAIYIIGINPKTPS